MGDRAAPALHPLADRLYTLWQTGSPGDIAFAVLHCTAGDVLIATGALVAALTVLGSPDWPRKRASSVGAAVIAIGLGYTAYSEHLNTAVRKAWASTRISCQHCPGSGLGWRRWHSGCWSPSSPSRGDATLVVTPALTGAPLG